jgi:hypothetical protein
MRADSTYRAIYEDERTSPEARLEQRKRKWERSLLCSITAALLTLTFGLFTSAVALMNVIPASGTLASAGSVLIAVSLPLLVLTGHCMDRLKEIDHAIRISRFRKSLFIYVEDISEPEE